MPRVSSQLSQKSGSKAFVVSPWLEKEDFRGHDGQSTSGYYRIIEEDLIGGVLQEGVAEKSAKSCREIVWDQLVEGHGVKDTESSATVSKCIDCILIKDFNGVLKGLLLSPDGKDGYLVGKIVELYRDCTRDPSWNVALLCFAFGRDPRELVYTLAENSCGDFLRLKAPVELTDEELSSIESYMARLDVSLKYLELEFVSEKIVDAECTAATLDACLNGLDQRARMWIKSICESSKNVSHINLGHLTIRMPSEDTNTTLRAD
jgi:hypothetical protein